MVRRTAPDVVLMDIRMPVLDGIAATEQITAAGLPTRVLVLTTYDLDRYVYGALQGRGGRVPAQGDAAGPAGRRGSRPSRPGRRCWRPSLTRRLIEEHVRRPAPGRRRARRAGRRSPTASGRCSC